MLIRWALAAGVLLSGFAAAAQDGGGANVRFEQLPSSLTIRAKIYKNDGDRNVETGEILAEQSYTATRAAGSRSAHSTSSPSARSTFPARVTACTGTGLSPGLPRFFVDNSTAIGIKSAADGTTANEKRINGLIPSTTPVASSERMQLTFNCTNALCGPVITSGHLILNQVDGTPRTILLYPTLGAAVVAPPLVINPGGTNPPGVTATFSGGKATVELSAAAIAALPAINGFQIGAGSANTRFTFREADMTFAQPQPDFVGFGCRIDLAQTTVGEAFKFVLPASSSQKFCPDASSNVLKLSCSGTIPNYVGGAVTATDEVECLISRSQCGDDDVVTATVKSIEITQRHRHREARVRGHD